MRLLHLATATAVLTASFAALPVLDVSAAPHAVAASVETVRMPAPRQMVVAAPAVAPDSTATDFTASSTSTGSAQPEAKASTEQAPTPTPVAAVRPAAPEAVTVESLLTQSTRGADVVGIGFPDKATAESVTVTVRTREGNRWGPWTEVGLSDSQPDPGTVEAKQARLATEPVGVVGSDEVQIRVRSANAKARLDRLTATFVDGGTSPADASMGRTPPSSASAGAVKPTIITRKEWGADESLRTCGPNYVSSIKGAVVHHTVNTNTYSSTDVPALLRGIYAYHVQGNGWCDVGYNFFVDRFGRLFEGRYGGDYRNVVGAQAQGFNSQTFGVASLANYDPATAGAVAPSSAVLSSIGKLVGWKAWLNGWDPSTTVTYTSAGSSRWPAGTVITKPRISGHRDFNLTTCPGDLMFDRLSSVRSTAATIFRAGVADATAETTAVAATETYTRPASGTFTLSGRGYGHGRGLSQYGAYGAATKGLTAAQILSFYYPGTVRSTAYGNPGLRVRLTALTTGGTQAVYQTGLVATDGTRTVDLRTASGALRARWRAVPDGAGLKLQYLDGTWKTLSGWAALAKPITFQNPSRSIVRVVLLGGAQREYRGAIRVHRSGTAAMSVNLVSSQAYLQGVVPAEMPPSWPTEALKAQAVAARTYAAYQASRQSSASLYDTCDTTSCQVYRGSGEWTTTGVAVQREWPSTTAAVAGTVGAVQMYGSTPALTEFGSSNGGQTAKSSLAYQKSFPDPYDAIAPGTTSAWKASIPVTSIEKAFPVTGSFRSLRVSARDGTSTWGGGRITSVIVTGASGSVTVTGDQFRSALGLRSTWWLVTSSPALSAPSLPEDLSGDGRADLLAVDSAGALRLLAGTGTLGFTSQLMGSGWSGLGLVAPAGAFDADARQDLVARQWGSLYLYPGDGKGGLLSRVYVSGGWDASNLVFAVGDLDGDRRSDLVERTVSGELRLHRGTGAGKVAGIVSLGTGWNQYRAVTSPGDLTGDEVPDVLSIRSSDSALLLHAGVRGGSLRAPVTVAGSWGAYSDLMGAGDVTGDGRDDVVARRAADGALVIFSGNDMGGLSLSSVVSGTSTWAPWTNWAP